MTEPGAFSIISSLMVITLRGAPGHLMGRQMSLEREGEDEQQTSLILGLAAVTSRTSEARDTL